jgi:hypothetical protein
MIRMLGMTLVEWEKLGKRCARLSRLIYASAHFSIFRFFDFSIFRFMIFHGRRAGYGRPGILPHTIRELEPEWARIAGPQFEVVPDVALTNYGYAAEDREIARNAGAIAGQGGVAAKRIRGGKGGAGRGGAVDPDDAGAGGADPDDAGAGGAGVGSAGASVSPRASCVKQPRGGGVGRLDIAERTARSRATKRKAELSPTDPLRRSKIVHAPGSSSSTDAASGGIGGCGDRQSWMAKAMEASVEEVLPEVAARLYSHISGKTPVDDKLPFAISGSNTVFYLSSAIPRAPVQVRLDASFTAEVEAMALVPERQLELRREARRVIRTVPFHGTEQSVAHIRGFLEWLRALVGEGEDYRATVEAPADGGAAGMARAVPVGEAIEALLDANIQAALPCFARRVRDHMQGQCVACFLWGSMIITLILALVGGGRQAYGGLEYRANQGDGVEHGFLCL